MQQMQDGAQLLLHDRSLPELYSERNGYQHVSLASTVVSHFSDDPGSFACCSGSAD